jgi:hypothetical protein
MKTITAILLIILTLTITACSENVSEIRTHTGGMKEGTNIIGASDSIIHRVRYDSLEHLLKSSTIVVIGELIEETQASHRYNAEVDDYSYAEAYNKLRIIEVLEGNARTGDTIRIAQAYAFQDAKQWTGNDGDVILVTYDDMTPMHKGDRWIYFLVFDTHFNVYVPVGWSDGRYPIPNREIMQVMDEFPRGATDFLNKSGKENWTENWKILNDAQKKAVDEIDIASLGVLRWWDWERGDGFNFPVYAEVLDYFDIEAQDWVNPGRSYDFKLLGLDREPAE